MKKYIKKPIVIEAIQLTRKNASVIYDWLGSSAGFNYNLGEFKEDTFYIEIETLEGVMTASESDYIIKGIKGEFYPCKEDVFNLTYEAVAVKE